MESTTTEKSAVMDLASIPASEPTTDDLMEQFGAGLGDSYRYDTYLDDTEDLPTNDLRPGRLKVAGDFGSNVLKFAHVPIKKGVHRLKGLEDTYERLYCCNGEGCVACRASVKGAQQAEIEFFYDLDNRSFVGYAAVSTGRRDSFGAKLRKACQGQIPSVLKIYRSETGGYQVVRNDNHSFDIAPLGPAVMTFRKALENNEVDFYDILPDIDNDYMLTIPAVRNNLPN